MAYNYGVKNTDPNFVIDSVTRSISQKSGKSKVMQNDHNSECYGFEIPRFIDGHDMSLCDITIHYINVSSNKSSVVTGSYPVSDVSVVGDNVVFTWLVSRNATGHNGTLNFAIGFERSTDGTVDYSWHTDIFKGITICETLYGDGSETVEPYSDVLTQWKTMLFGIGDTEEASIKKVSQAEQDAIVAKGAVVIASIPDDYSSTYYMANEAVRAKGNAIVESVDGECVVVSDSSDDYLRGLKIFGKSTQNVTTGAQLCNFPDVESYANEGITWSCKDGIVKVSGTSTAISSSSKEIKFNFPIKAGVYYLLGYTTNVMLLCCVTNSDGSLRYYQHTFTLDGTEQSVLIYCQIDSGKTVNETVYPMVSATDGATFETYSGGFASPSLDWSQEIESISDPSVTIIGKNLVNVAEEEINVYKLYDLDLPAGTYTFSAIVTSNDTDASDCLAVFKPADDSNIYVRFSRDIRQSMTFTSELPIVRMDLYAGTNYASSDGDVAVWKDVQLEFGNKATEYVPHVKQAIECTHTLPGIPVTSNGNYTDKDGQQWICDEIDFERGVYVRRIQTIAFDGSEEWYINNTDNTPANINRYFIANVLPEALSGGPVFGLYCNIAEWSGEISSDSFSEDGTVQGYGFTAYPGWIGFALNTTDYPDVASFKTKLAELNTAGTPATIYVANRVQPIEIPLTENELTAFKSLHSNYHNTTVLNNAGAYMQVKYNADTKSYIDNKFAELAAMITGNS